jgi:hypothetical protein
MVFEGVSKGQNIKSAGRNPIKQDRQRVFCVRALCIYP